MAVITKSLIVGGGGDYTSLITWESTEQQDLVNELGGSTYILNCSPGEEDMGTSQFYLTGWTTNATHFITIQGTNQCAMPWSATSTYTGRTSITGGLSIRGWRFNQANTVVKDIQLNLDSAANCYLGDIAASMTFESCIFRADAFASTPGFQIDAGTVYFLNCISWAHDAGNNAAYSRGFICAGTSTVYFVGCVVYVDASVTTNDYGVLASGAGVTTHCKNTLFFNYNQPFRDFFASLATITDTNCASSLSEIFSNLTTNRQVSLTDIWTDAANIDFRWTTAAKLDGTGTDVSAYSTRDILGSTRPGGANYDIGVYEKIPIVTAAINVLSECLLTAGGGLTTNAELLAESSATLDVLAELLLSVTNGGVVNTEVWSNAVLAAIGLSAELLLSVASPSSLGGEVLLPDVGANDVHAEVLLGAGGTLTLLAELILQATPATSSILAEFLTLVSAAKNVRAEVVGGLVASALGIPAEFLLSVEADSNLYIVFDYVDSRTFRIYCVTLGAEVRDFPGEFPERIYHADIGDEIRETDGSILAETRTNIATIEGNIR